MKPALGFLMMISLGLAGALMALDPQLGLLNERRPQDGILTAGQPTAAQLEAAKVAGYKTIVNLRPAAEDPSFDEAAKVAELGLEYIAIPITGAPDLTPENAAKLMAVLGDETKKPMLVHCASSNRVGALWALGSFQSGTKAEEALAQGLAAGLTKLEPAVRPLLGLPIPEPAPAAKSGG
jgi:uncharacterized protein (TIGR01244 family)